MKNFSFFTSEIFTGKLSSAGDVRGYQIAEKLGARVNPKSDYENDICIFVKCYPFENFPEKTYYDMGDQYPFAPWILAHPSAKVIAMSRVMREHIFEKVNRNDIILIPVHHCNYLCEVRERKEVSVVGVIGGFRSFEPRKKRWLISTLKSIGIDYIEVNHPGSRELVVDFHKKIDIQIAFRPIRSTAPLTGKLGTSVKLINAGSFKIPTVSYPEPAFVDEFDGCFLSVNTLEELITGIKKLKEDPVFYKELSEKAWERSQKYHIDEIMPLYQKLSE